MDTAAYTYKNKLKHTQPGMAKHYDFIKMAENGDTLGHEFLMLREPAEDMFVMTAETGALRLYLNQDKLVDCGNTAYISIRQSHHKFKADVTMDYSGLTGEDKAGMALLQNNLYHIRAEYCNGFVSVIKVQDGKELVLAKQQVPAFDSKLTLWIKADDEQADIGCGDITLAENMDIHELSTEVAGGFVGCTIGMYGTTDEEKTNAYVDFLSFSYKKCERIY